MATRPATDLDHAERLLARQIKSATATLGTVAREAIGRMVREGGAKPVLRPEQLFTDAEREQVAQALAAPMAAAHLLAVARVHERLQHARTQKPDFPVNRLRNFGENRQNDPGTHEEPFAAFGDEIPPLVPTAALAWFKRLVPALGSAIGTAGSWLAGIGRKAFTLAVATEETLLQKVKDVLAQSIEEGTPATDQVQAVLDSAGVSPANPQYACFLPGTLVEGNVLAASKARYSGPAVEIETDDGRRLRVTVNHPILTTFGWKDAGSIEQGDNLVCYGSNVESFTGRLAKRRAVHNQDVPARIEDVFESMLVESSSRLDGERPVRPFDFHGDAAFFNGGVNIVRADRMLWTHVDAEISQDGSKAVVMLGNVPATVPTSHRLSLLGLRLLGHLEPFADSLCFTDLALDSRVSGDRVEPFPPISKRVGSAANLDPSLFQAANKSPGGDVELCRKLVARLSGLVSLHRVIKIKRITWTGHVYDLQTSTGFLVAQGIIASNCMVVRTNILDAYHQGQAEALKPPEMQEEFPVWQYTNPDDSRSRPAHAERNGKYWPASVSLDQVRDAHGFDGFNCRCVAVPVWRGDWAELQQQGARVES